MSSAAVLALAGIVALALLANVEPGTFTVGTAVLVAAYLLFPVLLILAGGPGVIALLLLIGAAIERRAGSGR